MNTEPGEALACCLCSKPLTTLPNETAYCRNLKSNPSSFDDWKANSCPMARQSTCLPIVVWKALNASRAPLAAVGGDCKWCAEGSVPKFLDNDGVNCAISHDVGTLCHAHEEYWWPCLRFGRELKWPIDAAASSSLPAQRFVVHEPTGVVECNDSACPLGSTIVGWPHTFGEGCMYAATVLPAAELSAGPRCPKCGYVMCEQFDSRPVNALADIVTPNGTYICYRCTTLPAEPPPTPEQIVYNVAQRDPRFRKYLIEQLTAMGDEQDIGPLRTLQPLQPEGEQETTK